jgi:hypothetical protein
LRERQRDWLAEEVISQIESADALRLVSILLAVRIIVIHYSDVVGTKRAVAGKRVTKGVAM